MNLRWRVLLGAWLSLVVFLTLQWTTTGSLRAEPWNMWERVSLFVLGVLVVGGFVVVALDRGLNATAALVTILSVHLATMSNAPYAYEPSDPLFALTLGVVLGSLETLVYSRDVRRSLTTRTGGISLAVGVVHVCFGAALLYLEHSWRFPNLLSEYPLNMELLLYAALLLTVGAFASALILRRRAVSPLVLLVGWMGVAVSEAWQMHSAGRLPLFEPWGPPPTSLTPFPGYHWQLPSLVALVLAVLAAELLLRDVLEKSNRTPAPTPE